MKHLHFKSAMQDGEAAMPPCGVCGVAAYRDQRVLWPGLVRAWELAEHEETYINRQQGTVCEGCGSNLRSIALARALCLYFGHADTFDSLLRNAPQAGLLEINEAGTLHTRLARFPNYVFGGYPECDLMALPFDDGRFDVVVHSDTLEHVADPLLALQETRRVLAPEGAVIFTVPIVLGRLTRSRKGLEPSYHGAPGTEDADLLVHSEFGSDVWALVLRAGYSQCTLVPFSPPAGIAIVGYK